MRQSEIRMRKNEKGGRKGDKTSGKYISKETRGLSMRIQREQATIERYTKSNANFIEPRKSTRKIAT